MPETIPVFTEEQAAAMITSQHIIDELRTHTKPITYDPAEDEGKPHASMDEIWAAIGLHSFERRGPDPNGRDTLLLMNRPGPNGKQGDIKPLGNSWRNMAARPEYVPYRSLLLQYSGIISVSSPDQERSERHTVYAIHRPQTVLHGLGVLVGAQLALRHELLPVEADSSLAQAVQTAAERLEHAADSLQADDKSAARDLKAKAARASEQRFIPSSIETPVNGFQILNETGALALLNTIRYAAANWKDIGTHKH